jgi:transcriptional regulator of heat shock response
MNRRDKILKLIVDHFIKTAHPVEVRRCLMNTI